MNLTYYPFLIKLSTVFDIPLKEMNFSRVYSLYDTLTVDLHLNRKIPEQITEEDYHNMRHLYEWYNHLRFSRGLAQATNNEKLKDILTDFTARVQNPTSAMFKWRFLSAHDNDVGPLLLGLNISSAQCVEETYRRGYTDALNCDSNTEYASSIITELHSDAKGEYYVKIRHNGRYVYLCERKEVACGWEEFRNRLQAQVLSDREYYAICGGAPGEEGGRGKQDIIHE